MKRKIIVIIFGSLLMTFLSCGEEKDEIPSNGNNDNNGNKCEWIGTGSPCGDISDENGNDQEMGFYTTVQIINADCSCGGTYKFEDPNAIGMIGGIINLLDFGATIRNYKDPNNTDLIFFSYGVWGENHKKLMDIPPEGVKLPISRTSGDEFVWIIYLEDCVEAHTDCSYRADSVESDSYLTIYSFEYIGENQHLLVGSIKCTLLLNDGSWRIIEGNFSIPVEEIFG